jgi:CBS domain-containing protein
MTATTEFLDVPVDRVMTRRPDFVGAEGSIGDAAALMVWGGYRHLPVLDPDGRLVGMLSERDLRARLGSEPERFADAGRQLLDDTVESAMRPNPITVGPHARLRDVLEVLLDERVGALPVTDDADRLVGIVSYVDLLAFLHEGAAAVPPRRTTRRTAASKRRAAPKPAARRGATVAHAKRRRT